MNTPSRQLPAAYWRLWTASAISNLGDGVFLTALPLFATRLTSDEVQVSMVMVCISLPWLLLSLPVGTLVDRADRRTLMVAADVFRGGAIAGAGVLAWTGGLEMWMLWLLALCLGIGEVVFDNASQAILPSLVTAEQLDQANGWRYSVETTTNLFIGTPLGGVLLTVAVWLPFGVDAASYLIAAALVATLPARRTATTRAEQPPNLLGPTSVRDETLDGFRWLWRRPVLRSLAIALGVANLGFQIPNALFYLYAREEVGLSERWIAVVVGCMGAGAIVGGLIAHRVVARTGRTFALYASIAMWVASLLVYAAIPVAWVIVSISLLQAFAVTVWNVVTVSLRQQLIPDHLFGRVNSVYRWFGWGSIPIGAAVGGQVGRAVGLRWTYVVGAAVIASASLVLMRHVRGTALGGVDSTRRSEADDGTIERDSTPVALQRDDLDI